MATPAPSRFDIWVAALASGYTALDAFVQWADRRIDADLHQPLWVLNLSLSRDADEAEGVLWVEWSRRSKSPQREVPLLGEHAALHLGFLYLRHEEGRVSMENLLSEAGRYADSHGSGRVPECEAFYLLLNEIDGGGPIRKSDRPLPERVVELFAPMAAEARSALSHLPGDPAAG